MWLARFLPTSENDRGGLFRITNNLELLNPPASVFCDVDIVLGVHGDAMSLVEFTGEVPGAAEIRQDLAGLAVDNLDSRVVLIDEVHQSLIVRERQRHSRASALLRCSVGWWRERCPRGFDVLYEHAHLVVYLYPRSFPVAHVNQPIVGYGQTVDSLHAVRLPLA